MQIIYDKVSTDYIYPLGARSDIDELKGKIDDHLLNKISKIRFGCNLKTTQEARLVQRGEKFEIRINFCLKEYRSPIITDKKDWLQTIEKFGGKPDPKRNTVQWSLESAKKYSLFLLMHEIGHIVYCFKHFGGKLTNRKGSSTEEKWCEDYALNKINKI